MFIMSAEQKITATYQITCSAAEIKSAVREIAWEQTVEIPENLATAPNILSQVVAQIVSITPLGNDNRFAAVLEYNAALASAQLPQLLNLIFGNISLKNNIRLAELTLPGELLARWHGPNYGLAGLREMLGVFDRPLLATALKPRGATAQQLADIAGQFALGGGEIVKDDHNLVEASLDEFKRRVSQCQAAVTQANMRTGRYCLYLPNVCAPADAVERYLEFLMGLGVRGMMMAPFLAGLDVVRSLAARYRLVVMAHPAFTGTFFHDQRHGIEPGILLGTLFRLAGADISIFPNYGGRFCFSREECAGIAACLRNNLGNLRPAWPAPAGGMKFENIPALAEQFGPDAIYLCGGALLGHGKELRESTAALLGKVREHFKERLAAPQLGFTSACEYTAPPSSPPMLKSGESARLPAGVVVEHLPFQSGFSWQGRRPEEYKAAPDLPFKDVSRYELLGRNGEQAKFDLRYFEIAPGGYSSLEKHVHTHAIIALRGRGILRVGLRLYALQPFDVAHVPPLAAHQLRSATDEPFGFFCIVDHERDKPVAP
jgi:ribulose-bisphosphate carboxylase large chain